MLLVAAALLTAPDVQVGWATYYAPGLMEQVAGNRLTWGQINLCSDCVGYVALLDPRDIGRRVWVKYGHRWEGPFLVVDCAQAAHREGLIARDWVVDVDWQTSQRWRLRQPEWVTVSFEKRGRHETLTRR